MTDLDLTRLRELDKAATPGPWRVAADNEILSIGQREVVSADLDDEGEFPHAFLLLSDCNADLIAAMRNALPALLAEVDRLTRQLDAVKALADECRTKAKDRETMAMGAYAFGQAAQGNEWAGHAAVLLAFAERLDAITDTEKGA